MSRLAKLIAQPIKVTIGGLELDVKPLTMKDLPCLMSMSSDDPQKQAAAFQEVITLTLKSAVPDASNEEIEGVSVKYFEELSTAIMKANGLGENVDFKKGLIPNKKTE
jgi:hypothetical protein|tara:strand:- start:1433 stop:1756 length:324 start_codon:yes stop_codon:yes gene_type:complete